MSIRYANGGCRSFTTAVQSAGYGSTASTLLWRRDVRCNVAAVPVKFRARGDADIALTRSLVCHGTAVCIACRLGLLGHTQRLCRRYGMPS